MSVQLFAVMGMPIDQSLSPQIHTLFANQFNIKLNYEKIPVKLGQLKVAIDLFRIREGRGLNITMPLKSEAYQLCHPSEHAKLSEAVNILYWNEDGQLWGDNVDGLGLLNDVRVNLNWTLDGKRILICGAGGAAAGIIGPLLEACPSELVLANRHTERAIILAKRFEHSHLRASSYEALIGPFDVIFNATSVSLSNQALPLSSEHIKGAYCYDLAYSLNTTPFCIWAKAQGACEVKDGLGMLIEQAALGFEIWHGVKPHTKDIQEKLKNV